MALCVQIALLASTRMLAVRPVIHVLQTHISLKTDRVGQPRRVRYVLLASTQKSRLRHAPDVQQASTQALRCMTLTVWTVLKASSQMKRTRIAHGVEQERTRAQEHRHVQIVKQARLQVCLLSPLYLVPVAVFLVLQASTRAQDLYRAQIVKLVDTRAQQHRHAQIVKLTHSQTSAHPCARAVHQASTLKVQRVYVSTARPGQTTMSH